MGDEMADEIDAAALQELLEWLTENEFCGKDDTFLAVIVIRKREQTTVYRIIVL